MRISELKEEITNIMKTKNINDTYLFITTRYPTMVNDINLLFKVEYNDTINYTLQESRHYQQELRSGAIKRYGKCVISGKTDLLLLETAHIKQVYECDNYEKADINNVLLLWLDIHKYFDKYLISINPETLKVEIHGSITKDNKLYKYNGKDIMNINRESLKYLWHHYNIFTQKN